MRIQHNIAALNANRMLANNNNAVSKNLEKLSSGYKINRAGDDAAGLAISEKMRGQIRGLDQASNNASDGISLVQTAEGSLNETASILQRMKELATQSSNGTYQNDVDRENISKEVNSLKAEIDRISTSTNFNKINLLDGSLGSAKGATNVSKTLGATTEDAILTAAKSASQTFAVAGSTTAGDAHALSISYLDNDGKAQEVKVSFTGSATAVDNLTSAVAELNKTSLANDFNIKADAGKLKIESKVAGANKFHLISVSETNTGVSADVVLDTFSAGADKTFDLNLTNVDNSAASTVGTFDVDGKKFQIVKTGEKAKSGYTAIFTDDGKTSGTSQSAAIAAQLKDYGIKATAGAPSHVTITGASANEKSGNALTFQIGASGTEDQQVSLNVGDMSTKGLGLSAISVATQEDAKVSIATIDAAINQVSGTRADLGALQNRLEHTVTNLGTTSENLTSAESRIRDVDMAKEMMEMTKNNVLAQAAQSMLAQANTQPQNVLKLLQ
jgi:flagellin